MLDNKTVKSDTYRASQEPMNAASKFATTTERESESLPDPYNQIRLAESLARDPMVIASLRTSEQDIRQGRILSSEEALKRLRKPQF